MCVKSFNRAQYSKFRVRVQGTKYKYLAIIHWITFAVCLTGQNEKYLCDIVSENGKMEDYNCVDARSGKDLDIAGDIPSIFHEVPLIM